MALLKHKQSQVMELLRFFIWRLFVKNVQYNYRCIMCERAARLNYLNGQQLIYLY